MVRKTEQRMAREELVDLVRTVTRFHLRRQQRVTLNRVENDLLEEFDRRVADGRPFRLEVEARDWLDAVLGELDEALGDGS